MRLFLFLLLIPRLAMLVLLMMRIVTQQQAGQALGVGDRTIRNWISAGLIVGYRLPSGRAIRVDLDEITNQMKAIPTSFKPKVPFGPKAKIVDYPETDEAASPSPSSPQFVRPGVIRAEVIERGADAQTDSEAGAQDRAEAMSVRDR